MTANTTARYTGSEPLWVTSVSAPGPLEQAVVRPAVDPFADGLRRCRRAVRAHDDECDADPGEHDERGEEERKVEAGPELEARAARLRSSDSAATSSSAPNRPTAMPPEQRDRRQRTDGPGEGPPGAMVDGRDVVDPVLGTEEPDEHPDGVRGRQHRTGDHDDERDPHPSPTVLERRDCRLLAHEPQERRDPDHRQRAERGCGRQEGKRAPHPGDDADVAASRRVLDGADREEEARLEERMGHDQDDSGGGRLPLADAEQDDEEARAARRCRTRAAASRRIGGAPRPRRRASWCRRRSRASGATSRSPRRPARTGRRSAPRR